jgi:membrane protease YdiL (CAAX protease family)
MNNEVSPLEPAPKADELGEISPIPPPPLLAVLLLPFAAFLVALTVYAVLKYFPGLHLLPESMDDNRIVGLGLSADGIAMVGTIELVFLLAPWLKLRRSTNARKTLRLRWQPKVIWAAILCLGGVLSVSWLVLDLLSRWQWGAKALKHSSVTELNFAIETVKSGWVAALIATVLLAGVAEELMFRGFIQRRLVQRWGRWIGILTSSALFGLYHWDWVHTPIAFAQGLLLGWAVELTGSLFPSMFAHTLNNGLVVAAGLWERSSHSLDWGNRANAVFALVLLLLVVRGYRRSAWNRAAADEALSWPKEWQQIKRIRPEDRYRVGHAVLGFFLSLVGFGFGHAYGHRWKRAFAVSVAVWSALYIGCITCSLTSSNPRHWFGFWLLALTILFLNALWAGWTSLRVRGITGGQVRRALALLVLLLVCLQVAPYLLFRQFIMEAYRVTGSEMDPTLQVGTSCSFQGWV